MRVLYLLPHLVKGGAEKQMSLIAPELARRGHEVVVAYLYDSKYCPDLEGVQRRKLNANTNYDWRIVAQLIQLMRELRPDVLQTWIPQMDIIGGFAAKVVKVPHVLREASSGLAYPGGIKSNLRIRAARSASRIVVNSEAGRAYWNCSLPGKSIELIPNCLEPDVFQDIVPVDWRAAVGGSEGARVVYVGRLFNRAKNLDTLLQALVIANKRQPLSVALLGDGHDRPIVETFINDTQSSEYIRLLGSVPSALPYIKAAQAFVAVSHYEGRPNAVMESMALGCPMVLSDIPAHREMVDDRGAWYTDKDDPLAIADAIIRCINLQEQSANMALEAKRRTKDWTVARVADMVEALYETIIAGR